MKNLNKHALLQPPSNPPTHTLIVLPFFTYDFPFFHKYQSLRTLQTDIPTSRLHCLPERDSINFRSYLGTDTWKWPLCLPGSTRSHAPWQPMHVGKPPLSAVEAPTVWTCQFHSPWGVLVWALSTLPPTWAHLVPGFSLTNYFQTCASSQGHPQGDWGPEKMALANLCLYKQLNSLQIRLSARSWWPNFVNPWSRKHVGHWHDWLGMSLSIDMVGVPIITAPKGHFQIWRRWGKTPQDLWNTDLDICSV